MQPSNLVPDMGQPCS